MKNVQLTRNTSRTLKRTDSNISRFTSCCENVDYYSYFGTVKVVRTNSGTYRQEDVDAQMEVFEKWFGNQKFSTFITRNTGWVVLKKVYEDVEFISNLYVHIKKCGVQILNLSNIDDRNRKGKDAIKWFLVIACEQTARDMGLEYRWEIDKADNYEFHLD